MTIVLLSRVGIMDDKLILRRVVRDGLIII